MNYILDKCIWSTVTALIMVAAAVADDGRNPIREYSLSNDPSANKNAQIRDVAGAFAIGKAAGNEAVMEYVSKPKTYGDMAKARKDAGAAPVENIKMDSVEIVDVDGNRATAKATYHQQLTGKSVQEEIHLINVDGKWEVTTPPESTEK